MPDNKPVTLPVDIIGAAQGWGAQIHETEYGPQSLYDWGLISELKKIQRSFLWDTVQTQASIKNTSQLAYSQRLEELAFFNEGLAIKVAASLQAQHFPLVIGGDHSIAIGTWSGVTSALAAEGNFGLIWLDAHMDSHTQDTTPSQAIHGMPLAALMGYGEHQLTHIVDSKPKLSPQHVVLIGARSYEAGEAALLKKLNVKIFYNDDVKKMGFNNVLNEAMKIVTHNTKGFGLSIDLDAFDPTLAPGVGTPESDGLDPTMVIPALSSIKQHPQFKALEIAEFNPARDQDNKTAKIILKLIQALI